MFLYYFVHVPRPLVAVTNGVIEAAGHLSGMAGQAIRTAEKAAPQVRGSGLTRLVRIDCGEPLVGLDSVTFPLKWKAMGDVGLLPKMTAELSVGAVGPGHTQLTFRGNYQPPLGIFGKIVDRAVMHRLAELVVKSFMDQLARALQDTDPARVASLGCSDRGLTTQ